MKYSTTALSAVFAMLAFVPTIALADAGRGKVVFASSPSEAASNKTPALLTRELYRQAALIAARDELGLATRDEVLRETPPADDQDIAAQTLQFQVTNSRTRLEYVSLNISLPNADPFKLEVRLKQVENFPFAPTIADDAETKSRTTFVDWLKKNGFDGSPNAVAAEAALPDDEESRLESMSILAQFAAVQQAHAAIRAGGENSAMLEALTRGYANLAQLTRFHWTAESDVYAARAMLYSRRMLNKFPDSPDSLRCVAYADIMAGFPADAMDYLSKIKPGGPPAPAWAKLIEPLFNYQTKALLDAAAADPTVAGLASFMAFMTIENTGSQSMIIEMGKLVLQYSPTNERVLDAMAEPAGVGYLHTLTDMGFSMTVDSLRHDLSQFPRLPQSVTAALTAAHTNPDLNSDVADVSQAFVAASESAEPSWSAVGESMKETNFVHTYRRVYFETNDWAVDPTDTINQTAPLVAGHPLALLIPALNDEFQQKPAPEGLADLKFTGATMRISSLMSPLNLMNHYQMTQAATAYYARQELLTSYGCWDLEMGMASADPFKSNTGIAAKLSKLVMTISPHSAIGAAGQVRSAFASIPAATLDAWSKEFVDNPAFNTALAVHYRDQGQVQAAIPYFANALRMSPDYSSVENLADAYKQVNDIDHWLSTLKDAMQREDYGLDHAQYNGQIAHYYMDKGDYQSALPYAEASNESGASWAMETLIICQTQLGDFKEANELWKEETDRYGPVPQWYIWCVLTDHGDLAQAKDVANAWLATGKPNGMTRVWVDEMEGNHPDQIKQMRAQYGQTKNPFDAAFLAILYDHAGDAANAVKFAAVAAQSDAGPTGQIAHLIQSSMETGKITYTMEQVMQIVSPLKITEQTPLIYLTADYLIHHGQEAEGLKWLVFVARHTAANSGSGYLAQFELHAHKIDVYHLPPDPAGAGAQPTTQQ